MIGTSWTPEEDAILRRMREQHGRGWLKPAMTLLPNRTEGAVSVRECFLRKGRTKKAAVAPTRFPDAKPTVTLRAGPLDRGERELLRKRLVYVAGSFALEVRRTPTEVFAAVRDIVKANFRMDPSLDWNVDRDEAGALGTAETAYVPKESRDTRRAVNARKGRAVSLARQR